MMHETLVVSIIRKHWRELFPAQPLPSNLSCIQISGTPGAYGKITFLLFGDKPFPILVAKLARDLTSYSLWLEYKHLKFIREKVSSKLRKAIPVPWLLLDDESGAVLLCESVIEGQSLSQTLKRHVAQGKTGAWEGLNQLMLWLEAFYIEQELALVPLREYWKERWYKLSFDVKGIELAQNSIMNEILLKVESQVRALKDHLIPIGYLHGDLTTSNVLVNAKGEIGILDWGRKGWEERKTPLLDIFNFWHHVFLDLLSCGWLGHHCAPEDAFFRAFFTRNWFSELARRFIHYLAKAIGLKEVPLSLLYEMFILENFVMVNREGTFACIADLERWKKDWTQIAQLYLQHCARFALAETATCYQVPGRFVQGLYRVKNSSKLPKEVDVSSPDNLGWGWHYAESDPQGKKFRYIEGPAEVLLEPSPDEDLLYVELHTVRDFRWRAQVIEFYINDVFLGKVRSKGASLIRFLGSIPPEVRGQGPVLLLIKPKVVFRASKIDVRHIGCAVFKIALLSSQSFRPTVDFSSFDFNPYQLGSGWYQVEEGFCWIGRQAEVFLPQANRGQKITIHCSALMKFLGQKSLHLTVYVNGQKTYTHKWDASELGEIPIPCNLEFEIPESSCNQGYLHLRLCLNRTFRAPGDQRELGCMVHLIAVV